MELFWVYYQGSKSTKYILLLHLGDKDGKHCGLDTKFITEADNKIIYSFITELHNLSLGKKLSWIKEKLPKSYKHAYKKLNKNNSTIIEKYPINK